MAELVAMGVAFRQEFDDVVVLQTRHRLVDEKDAQAVEDKAVLDGSTPQDAAALRAEFEADGRRFAEVTQGLSDLSWTPDDRDWLARRNRRAILGRPNGAAEVAKFSESPVLMDARKQRVEAADGGPPVDIDGADLENLKELYKLAADRGVPVARIGAYHRKEDGKDALKAELLDDDDFGLAASLELCIGARVLLTRNLWTDAGLMNGALGVVKGFVWPAGGDPNSSDSRKRAPLCVIVEFDDIDLRKIVGRDMENRPVLEERCFFPELGPDFARCVPIFREDAASAHDKSIIRQQFPLTLAWAVTHWKAQGMTLKRARIRIGRNVAGQPGVAFVAITRVGHPWHLMFDTDLPGFDTFEQAKYKEEFRSRERYELRLKAKASDTLRRYGFCTADPWGREDAAVAERLLGRMRVAAAQARRSAGLIGDDDAWPWMDVDEPPVDEQFGLALAKEYPEDAVASDRASYDRAVDVVHRLCGALHMPAVLDALGCLIPKKLHRQLDGVKPRVRAQARIDLLVPQQIPPPAVWARLEVLTLRLRYA